MKRFFPELEECTYDIKNAKSVLRELRRKHKSNGKVEEVIKDDIDKQFSRVNSLKAYKSKAIDEVLEVVTNKIATDSFSIGLMKIGELDSKPIYSIEEKPESFFVVKLLQRNIRKLYGVQPSNRHLLLCQIRDTLHSDFPYTIVRTDISSFYESIKRSSLLHKLDEDQLLSFTSKKFIKQITDSYENLSKNHEGIPRGVGTSAYLAELYLRRFDRKVRRLKGIVLYCRFVDDVVAIFAQPSRGAQEVSYKDRIVSILNELELNANVEKTLEFEEGSKVCFDYLGYRFSREYRKGSKLEISPSQKRLDRIKQRLVLSFNEYSRTRLFKPKKAFKLLVARVKYLTGNTRLSNSKSAACTGLFFNNDLITKSSVFCELDKELERLILETKNENLKRRLSQITFASGFEERRFHNFDDLDLKQTVRVWRNV